jgi:hypothetical protein
VKYARTFVLLSCALALTTAAYSQTWVSNTGSDSGTCSIFAPCATFAYAVSQTQAWGHLGVLNAGDYGTVTINKAIEIDGGGLASITAGLGTAITVSTPAGSVVQLHNLKLHGVLAKDGIDFLGSGGLDLDNVQVTGFGGNCISVNPAKGSGATDVVIKDSTVENCAVGGINLSSITSGVFITAKVINTHVRFANTGLVGNSYMSVTAYDSTFSSPSYGGTTTGVSATNGASITLDNCQVIGFGFGISTQNAYSVVWVNRSTLINNANALVGSGIFSYGNNALAANAQNGAFNPQIIALQ